jgi:hypothetical protein
MGGWESGRRVWLGDEEGGGDPCSAALGGRGHGRTSGASSGGAESMGRGETCEVGMKGLQSQSGRPGAGAGDVGPSYNSLQDEASLAGLRTSISTSQRGLAKRQFSHEAGSAGRSGLTNKKWLVQLG